MKLKDIFGQFLILLMCLFKNGSSQRPRQITDFRGGMHIPSDISQWSRNVISPNDLRPSSGNPVLPINMQTFRSISRRRPRITNTNNQMLGQAFRTSRRRIEQTLPERDSNFPVTVSQSSHTVRTGTSRTSNSANPSDGSSSTSERRQRLIDMQNTFNFILSTGRLPRGVAVVMNNGRPSLLRINPRQQAQHPFSRAQVVRILENIRRSLSVSGTSEAGIPVSEQSLRERVDRFGRAGSILALGTSTRNTVIDDTGQLSRHQTDSNVMHNSVSSSHAQSPIGSTIADHNLSSMHAQSKIESNFAIGTDSNFAMGTDSNFAIGTDLEKHAYIQTVSNAQTVGLPASFDQRDTRVSSNAVNLQLPKPEPTVLFDVPGLSPRTIIRHKTVIADSRKTKSGSDHTIQSGIAPTLQTPVSELTIDSGIHSTRQSQVHNTGVQMGGETLSNDPYILEIYEKINREKALLDDIKVQQNSLKNAKRIENHIEETSSTSTLLSDIAVLQDILKTIDKAGATHPHADMLSHQTPSSSVNDLLSPSVLNQDATQTTGLQSSQLLSQVSDLQSSQLLSQTSDHQSSQLLNSNTDISNILKTLEQQNGLTQNMDIAQLSQNALTSGSGNMNNGVDTKADIFNLINNIGHNPTVSNVIPDVVSHASPQPLNAHIGISNQNMNLNGMSNDQFTSNSAHGLHQAINTNLPLHNHNILAQNAMFHSGQSPVLPNPMMNAHNLNLLGHGHVGLFGQRLPSEFIQEMMFGDTTDPPDPVTTTAAPTTTAPSTTTTAHVFNKSLLPVNLKHHQNVNNAATLNNILTSLKQSGVKSGFKLLFRLPGSNTSIPIEVLSQADLNFKNDLKSGIPGAIDVKSTQANNLKMPAHNFQEANINGNTVLPNTNTLQNPYQSNVLQTETSTDRYRNTMISKLQQTLNQNQMSIEPQVSKTMHNASKPIIQGVMQQNTNTQVQAQTVNPIPNTKVELLGNAVSQLNSMISNQINLSNNLLNSGNSQQHASQDGQRLIPYKPKITTPVYTVALNPNQDFQNQPLPTAVPLIRFNQQNSGMQMKNMGAQPNAANQENKQLTNRLQRIENMMQQILATTTRAPTTTPFIEPDEIEPEEMPVTTTTTQKPPQYQQQFDQLPYKPVYFSGDQHGQQRPNQNHNSFSGRQHFQNQGFNRHDQNRFDFNGNQGSGFRNNVQHNNMNQQNFGSNQNGGHSSDFNNNGFQNHRQGHTMNSPPDTQFRNNQQHHSNSQQPSLNTKILSQGQSLVGQNNMNSVPTTTDTTLQCHPNLPNFSCEGVGMFKSMQSIDAWCVSKCVQGQCVDSVCQCGCYVNSKNANRINEIGNEIASLTTGHGGHTSNTNKALTDLYDSLNSEAAVHGFVVSPVEKASKSEVRTTTAPSDTISLLSSIEKMIETKLKKMNPDKTNTDFTNKGHESSIDPRRPTVSKSDFTNNNQMHNMHVSNSWNNQPNQNNNFPPNNWGNNNNQHSHNSNWNSQSRGWNDNSNPGFDRRQGNQWNNPPQSNQWRNGGHWSNGPSTPANWQNPQRRNWGMTTTQRTWSFQGRGHWKNNPPSKNEQNQGEGGGEAEQ